MTAAGLVSSSRPLKRYSSFPRAVVAVALFGQSPLITYKAISPPVGAIHVGVVGIAGTTFCGKLRLGGDATPVGGRVVGSVTEGVPTNPALAIITDDLGGITGAVPGYAELVTGPDDVLIMPLLIHGIAVKVSGVPGVLGRVAYARV
jgi:hypothetical protein